MKKILSVLLSLVMVLMPLAIVASASNFVPSIGYKPAPDINNNPNGNIIITSVEEAPTTTKIPRAVADDLLAKYAIVSDSSFKLSSWNDDLNKSVAEVLGEQYDADSLVIREFFNVYSYDESINDYIEVDGQSVTLEFDIDLGGKPLFVLICYDDQWHFSQVVENGNGAATISFAIAAKADGESVAISFEEFGHVAMLVPVDGYDDGESGGTPGDDTSDDDATSGDTSDDVTSEDDVSGGDASEDDASSDASKDDASDDTPQTGDSSDKTIWMFVMFAALAAIVALVVANRESFKLKSN